MGCCACNSPLLVVLRSVVDLGQATGGGFAVAGVHVFARFVHDLHDLVKGDLMLAFQRLGQHHGIDRLDGRHGVALDAGDLHKPQHRVAGQPQVVLQRDLGRAFYGGDIQPVDLCQRGGCHGAGGLPV